MLSSYVLAKALGRNNTYYRATSQFSLIKTETVSFFCRLMHQIALHTHSVQHPASRAFLNSKKKKGLNLVPRVFHLPTQKEAREERPWFRLVTCLGDKFMLVGGVPVFQTIVAVAICNIQNDLVSLRVTLESSFSIE